MVVLRSKVLQELGTVAASEADGSSLDARLVMKEGSEPSQLGFLLEREVHTAVVSIRHVPVVRGTLEPFDYLVWHRQEVVSEVLDVVDMEGANDGVEGPRWMARVESGKERCRRDVVCHGESNHHGFLSRGERSKVGSRAGHLERRT